MFIRLKRHGTIWRDYWVVSETDEKVTRENQKIAVLDERIKINDIMTLNKILRSLVGDLPC